VENVKPAGLDILTFCIHGDNTVIKLYYILHFPNASAALWIAVLWVLGSSRMAEFKLENVGYTRI